MHTIDAHAAARLLADILYSDSHVPQAESLPVLLRAVLEDGAAPTEEEAVLLVEGTDEGDVPEELVARFPAVDEALASFF